MIGFSRFDSVIMVFGYIMYLVFQLGSHQDDFEDSVEEETTVEGIEQKATATKGR